MDPIMLNRLLTSIMKSREIQRNRVQERSTEQAGFRDYAKKLGAQVVEAENKNTKMISDI